MTFLHLPNELILQIASYLSLVDLNDLLRANRHLCTLLSPVLLKQALTAKVLSSRSCYQRPVLHWACAENRLELMVALLDMGTPYLNAVDYYEMTPLHSAICLENEGAVKILLDYGASTTIINRWGWTPLILAVVTGNESIVKMLIEEGADLDAVGCRTNKRGALHFAAALGHQHIVEILMDAGCDTRRFDAFRFNAAQCAVGEGHEILALRMLELGEFEKVRADPFMDTCISEWTRALQKMLVGREDSYRMFFAATLYWPSRRMKLWEMVLSSMIYQVIRILWRNYMYGYKN